MNILKNRALKIATKSVERADERKIAKDALKKEKAIAYLIGLNEDTLSPDNSLDRFWIEHTYPFMTAYSYCEDFVTFKDAYESDGNLIIDINCEEFELAYSMEEENTEDLWTVLTTGNTMEYIQNDYDSCITLIINNQYELRLDLMEIANEQYRTKTLPNEIQIPRAYILNMLNN